MTGLYVLQNPLQLLFQSFCVKIVGLQLTWLSNYGQLSIIFVYTVEELIIQEYAKLSHTSTSVKD